MVYHGDGRFTLRVVAGDGFDDAVLLAAFRQRVPGVAVDVEHVEAIRRGPRGKFDFIAVERSERAPAQPGRILMFGTDDGGRGGIAATVASWRRPGWFEREGIRYVPSHVDGASWRKLRTAALACLSLLKARPGIVHVHAASGASFARKAVLLAIARGLGCKTVFHLHGGGFRAFAQAHRRIVRYTLERSSAVLALSADWARLLQSIAPRARVRVLPNAVALAAAPDTAVVEPGRILFLGRLSVDKGVFDLLDAVACLPGAHLVLAGAGNADGIRRRAQQLGIAGRLSLPGWLDAPSCARELARAAIFCLPSHAEGLPLAMLEAMAAGKAVVATAVGAIPEVLNTDAGVLVTPGDTNALAAALGQLIDDPALASAMGQRARAMVAAHYELDTVGAQLAQLYRSLEAGA